MGTSKSLVWSQEGAGGFGSRIQEGSGRVLVMLGLN